MNESNAKIIELLAAGKVYKEIASETGLHLRTVKYRIKAMKRRFGFVTVPQLVYQLMVKLHQKTTSKNETHY